MQRLLLFASLLFPLSSCGSAAPAGPDETQPDAGAARGDVAVEDLFGSCEVPDGNQCGGQSDGNCWCDDLCTSFADCCSDRAEICDCQPLSCQEAGATCGEVADGCGATLDCGPCPPIASGTFELDMPTFVTGPFPKTAVLSVPTIGDLGIYSEVGGIYNNGTDSAPFSLMRQDRVSDGWDRNGIASHSASTPHAVAATHGDDPCVAYIHEGATLRLRCDSLSDRLIATGASKSVAMAASTSQRDLVFVHLEELKYVGDTFEGQPPLATVVDQSWVISSTSIAVDSTGAVHVAYIAFESDGERTLRYALKTESGWTTEAVDTDSWTGNPQEGDTVSLALTPAGQPVIAYYHRATRSLKLATSDAGSFALQTVEAPRVDGGENDSVGSSLALQIDWAGNQHLVYAQINIFDSDDFIGLRYARLDEGEFVDKQDLPFVPTVDFLFYGVVNGLSFYATPEGAQHVAAIVSASHVYYAHR